jgi:hypothetical protein
MMQTTLETITDHHPEYDEQTFRSLLDLEHHKCRQSGQVFHVVLCRLSTQNGMPCLMNESVKSTLASAVRESLRKEDSMGWFLQDLVLGALLLSMDPRQSGISSGNRTDQIRRQIESRLSLVHPSLALQIYDYLDLPPIPQRDRKDATNRALVRQD